MSETAKREKIEVTMATKARTNYAMVIVAGRFMISDNPHPQMHPKMKTNDKKYTE